MDKTSIGLLPYRRVDGRIEVFLVHPGGPFWSKKDAGAWTVPKGEPLPGEAPLATARREFAEETGLPAPDGPAMALTPVRQAGGKRVIAFAVAAAIDPARLSSNTFPLAWPPRSGRMRQFPEVDRGDWFSLEAAAAKINPGQRPLLVELAERLGA